jgi:hypothetical protein
MTFGTDRYGRMVNLLAIDPVNPYQELDSHSAMIYERIQADRERQQDRMDLIFERKCAEEKFQKEVVNIHFNFLDDCLGKNGRG